MSKFERVIRGEGDEWKKGKRNLIEICCKVKRKQEDLEEVNKDRVAANPVTTALRSLIFSRVKP